MIVIVMYHKFGYGLTVLNKSILRWYALEDQTCDTQKTVGLPVAMATLLILRNGKITTWSTTTYS
jgi:hypothetical protein